MNKIKVLLMLIIILSIANISYAANPKVQLNGNIMDFTDEQGNRVEAQLINNRTMVPLRKIFESLGCTIDWNQETKTVTAKQNNKTIKLTIGNNNASLINNDIEEKIVLDSAPVIVDNRTLVPLRFIAESLGCDVGWDQKNQTAIIVDYEEIAKMIATKSEYLYRFGSEINSIKIVEKYYDDADSSRNYVTQYEFEGPLNSDEYRVNMKISGTSEFAKEVENEEWNNVECVINDDDTFVTANYALSSMLKLKKNEKGKIDYEKFGLSKERAMNIKDWIKLVSNIDTSLMTINTYKNLKSEWNKFINIFMSGSKTLKASDFQFEILSLNRMLTTRSSKELTLAMLLNSAALRFELNYQDLLSDYPVITYSFTSDSNNIKLVINLKNEYKERREFEITLLTMNLT
ncbi:MAG: copper amine oxidase N-terminal domain-containing protein [Clostridia bacterium]|nr:copper amine oxidase N-terminal domain-containing protein [Clostridia bacterium]